MSKYEINALIKAIEDKELRKRTLSLVETILVKKHMIWGFIRYPEMADHCERHTRNVFELLTRFLVYSQKHLLEGENKLHACSVKGICKSILFKHTKITVYLQKQMLFL
jgi:hypothetical protein